MTTIVLIRKNNEVVVAGDGQVSMGNTVIKSTAAKVRRFNLWRKIMDLKDKIISIALASLIGLIGFNLKETWSNEKDIC